MIRAVLFDVDNTLYETDRAFEQTLISAVGMLLEKGVALPNISVQRMREVKRMNLPFEVVFQELFGSHGDAVLAAYRDIAPSILYTPTPHAQDAIAFCKKSQLRMGLVTNRVRMLEDRLTQAGFFIDDFVCASMPASKQFAKPHPRAFEEALGVLRTYGISPHEVVMVGDHTDDFYSAKAQGVAFIGVLQGATERKDFIEAGVSEQLIIGDLGRLEETIGLAEKIRAYTRSLECASAIDTRYAIEADRLQPYISEYAFHKYRVMAEIEHVIALSEYTGGEVVRKLEPEEKEALRNLYRNFSLQDGYAILSYDHLGRKGIGPLEHDTKACEVWIQEQLIGSSMEDLIPKIHMFVTSEDIRNLALKTMVREAIETVIVPEVYSIADRLTALTEEYAGAPVMGRTHMQPASPTTFGKIFSTYLVRYTRALHRLQQVQLYAKVNGAVGNYNSFVATYPHIDWQGYSEYLTNNLGFFTEPWTDQRGPMRDMVELFQALQEIGVVTRDMAQDMSLYASLGTLYFTKVESHVGSSVMPHKINPWFAEVAEGSLKKAHALVSVLATDLDVSRLQRDLSDHELERGYGDILGYLLIGLTHAGIGLGMAVPHVAYAQKELLEHREIVTEAIQTILRKHGEDDAYALVKQFSRGARVTAESLQEFIDSLPITDTIKDELAAVLDPTAYTGLAEALARRAVQFYKDAYFSP